MKYKHKVDKSKIPTCNILGVNIAAINMKWLLEYIKDNIKDLSSDYICVANVHTTIMSYEDSNYRNILNNGVMAIPDGGPLSTVGKKRGHKSMERTTGPSLMSELFKQTKENCYRYYFYGSTKKTLNKLRIKLEKTYPNIQIVGMYSPPFRLLTDEEDATVVKIINNSNPDIVFVGLGALKQELWMNEHQGKVSGLMIGVGAGFDYLAGNINRAPQWMQKFNLEWVYRLLQDPKRLFGRYWNTNTKFIWNVMVKGK